jgi:hypothetical protein
MQTIEREHARERDQVGRAIGVLGLLGIALVHVLDAGSKLHETPYMFVLYLGLMAIALVVAAVLLRTDSRLAWILVTAISALTFLGYVLTRTTGLPGAMDDIGNWTEPLGLSSLFIEGCMVLLGIYKVATTPPVHGLPIESKVLRTARVPTRESVSDPVARI